MTNTNYTSSVQKLLRINSPDNFINDLNEMWEAWITSDSIDGSTASQRAEMLVSYKALCQMLRDINPNYKDHE